MSASFQLWPALDAATEAALRESIIRFGVLVPVVRDQHGRPLDGHHRSRIADDLGVTYRVDVVNVTDDEEALAVSRTLNSDRRHMDAPQRREVEAALREQGHSFRAIAGALGVGKSQVKRDLAGVPNGTPAETLGRDGKRYPSRRPTVVAAKNEREAGRAQTALASLDSSPASVIDVRRAERLAREQAADIRRAEPIDATSLTGEAEIRHGDFRSVLDDLAGTVDAIITDPPYAQEFQMLYGPLAETAAFLLAEGGSLVVLCGTRPDAWLRRIPQMEAELPLRWVGCYLTEGTSWRDHAAQVATNWKPVLIFGRGPNLNSDVWRSSGDDKTSHEWGQNADAFTSLVESFTAPGDLVVDPFLGGGTTAVVCKALGRRFVGCDVDAAAVASTRVRLAS